MEIIADARTRDDFQRYLMDLGRLFLFDNVLSDIDMATPMDLLVIVPDTDIYVYQWLHVGTQDNITLEIFEAPQVGFDGVGLELNNANRRSENTPTVQMNIAATITDPGEQLRKQQFDSGMVETPHLRTPMILARNQRYLLRFTAAVSTNNVNLFVAFGEHMPNA